MNVVRPYHDDSSPRHVKRMAKKSTGNKQLAERSANKTDSSMFGDTQRRRAKPDRFAEPAPEDLVSQALRLPKIPVLPRRSPCGTCKNCLKEECGVCYQCRYKKQNGKSVGACRERLCSDYQEQQGPGDNVGKETTPRGAGSTECAGDFIPPEASNTLKESRSKPTRHPCGVCENCQKEDCGNCYKCTYKKMHNKSQGVCYKRLCLNYQDHRPSILEGGTVKKKATPNAPRRPCGSCQNCLKPDCGECGKCKYRAEHQWSIGVCMKRLCLSYQTGTSPMANTLARLSSSSSSSSSDALSVNAEEKDGHGAARHHRVPCRQCKNCLKEDCGECGRCIYKKNYGKSAGVCERRLCLNYQKSKRQKATRVKSKDTASLASKSKKGSSDPEEGDFVYAKWKKGAHAGEYYWGRVTKKFLCKSALLYNIQFMDGDFGARFSRLDIYSEEEFLAHFTEDYYRETTGGKEPPPRSKSSNRKRKGELATRDVEKAKKVKAAERQQIFQHELLGKMILHEWLDRNLKTRCLYGTIKSCYQGNEGSLVFEVEYADESIKVAKELMPGFPIEKSETILEEDAWGLRCARLNREGCPVPDIERVTRWIVPDKIKDVKVEDRLVYPPRRKLIVRGCRVKLRASKSEIPNAGLGVFIYVSPPKGTEVAEDENFVLKQGELIDLGVYGPLREEDLREDVLVLVKSFLFEDKPEEWVFDAKEEDGARVFDITNDKNGDLHDLAAHNILSFVNETDGHQPASIHARRDFFSHVHYMLGPDDNQSELLLPYKQWIELKVDYGPSYERVRIRKGYSRLPEGSNERTMMEEQTHDSTTLQDIKHWCAKETKISIDYLSKLDLDEMDAGPRLQALVISLCLYDRLQLVGKELEDADFRNSAIKALSLIKRIVKLVKDEQLSNHFKRSETRAELHLANFLGQPTDTIQKMFGEHFRKAICQRVRDLHQTMRQSNETQSSPPQV